jgi:hypothetical protein
MQRLGVAAGEHPLLQGLAHLGREQGIDPGAGLAGQFATRKRQQ